MHRRVTLHKQKCWRHIFLWVCLLWRSLLTCHLSQAERTHVLHGLMLTFWILLLLSQLLFLKLHCETLKRWRETSKQNPIFFTKLKIRACLLLSPLGSFWQQLRQTCCILICCVLLCLVIRLWSLPYLHRLLLNSTNYNCLPNLKLLQLTNCWKSFQY